MRTIATFILVVCIACDSPKKESSEIAKDHNKDSFETWEKRKDADFVVEAVAEHYASIRLAQLAMNKSGNPEIRELAAAIEMDQARELQRFTGFANRKGISIPTEENEIAKDKLDELANGESERFDEKWCRDLAKRNERDIQSFESMWEKTEDGELKDLINESLPEMRTHLVRLRSAQEKLAMN